MPEQMQRYASAEKLKQELDRWKQHYGSTAQLPFEKATVPTEWTDTYGHLKSFHFQSKDVESFAGQMKDTAVYRSRSKSLFQSWFGGDVDDAVKLLISELRNDKTATQIKMLRKDAETALGKLQSLEHQSESFDARGKRLTQTWKLVFTDGEARGRAVFEFDAFHSYLVQADITTTIQENAEKVEPKGEQQQSTK